MKKILAYTIVGLLAGMVNTSVMAGTACNGDPTKAAAVTGKADGTTFVRVTFTPKCSANTLVDYEDQTTNFAVAAGSLKGKATFIGSTAGGGVAKSADCAAASGCVAADIATALGAAKALAGGS